MTVINLNKARKARLRQDATKTANQNAVKFGRSKAEKTLEAAQSDTSIKRLDGHKVQDD
ncbi:MAG: DUF4169 family protein [Halocynthiibacter sp.]